MRAPPAPARETAAKTAAGSVGESTAPSSSACVQPRSANVCAASATRPNVAAVPAIPSVSTGASCRAHGVQTADEPALQQHDHERDGAEHGDRIGPRRRRAEPSQSSPSSSPPSRNASGVGTPSARATGSSASAAAAAPPATASSSASSCALTRVYPRASARLMAETTARRLAVTML